MVSQDFFFITSDPKFKSGVGKLKTLLPYNYKGAGLSLPLLSINKTYLNKYKRKVKYIFEKIWWANAIDKYLRLKIRVVCGKIFKLSCVFMEFFISEIF